MWTNLSGILILGLSSKQLRTDLAAYSFWTKWSTTQGLHLLSCGDDKLNTLEHTPYLECAKNQVASNMNIVQRSALILLNSSLCWLEIRASPFCSF